MAGVKITVDNQPVLEALQRLAGAAGDTNGALLNIGEHLRASTIARILAEQAPDGTPWPRLSPAYAARKKGPGILREAGTLAQIVYQVAPSCASGIFRPSPFFASASGCMRSIPC